ncbi:MAG: stage II sporulation protein P [Peptococcaceae bacterium]|nr:stage II sporulation protein P [Candidatus Syntrophopropionicum ammoniitolerans]
MKSNTGKLLLTLTALFIVTVFSAIFLAGKDSTTALSSSWFFQARRCEAPEYEPGRYITIFDEQENVISMMSRGVHAGDEIYTAEGRTYRLQRVDGEQATARFMGMDPQIVALNEFFATQEVPVAGKDTKKGQAAPANFAIYHTHTDECYVPTEGTHTLKFHGGILQVGTVMAEHLRQAGMLVNHDVTRHDPHDNNAYVRSRRTAVKLLSSKPAALFDVHRDGIPDPNYYRVNIDGRSVASLRLVIGRQNPGMSANLGFAKQMLASVNNAHPKVVKEIFVGKGDFNQDLSPTALLLEAGTHTNSREEAERGIGLFADSVPTAMGISTVSPAPKGTVTAPTKSKGAAGGAWKAVGWILGTTAAGALAFLLINKENLPDLGKRLRDFGREIVPLIPRPAARKLGLNIEKGEEDGKNEGE